MKSAISKNSRSRAYSLIVFSMAYTTNPDGKQSSTQYLNLHLHHLCNEDLKQAWSKTICGRRFTDMGCGSKTLINLWIQQKAQEWIFPQQRSICLYILWNSWKSSLLGTWFRPSMTRMGCPLLSCPCMYSFLALSSPEISDSRMYLCGCCGIKDVLHFWCLAIAFAASSTSKECSLRNRSRSASSNSFKIQANAGQCT